MSAATQPSDDELVKLQHTLYTSRNPTRRWLHHRRRAWVLRAITEAARTPGATGSYALEVGPGSGVYLHALRQGFDHVVVSDIELRYLHAIRRDDTDYAFMVDDVTRSSLAESTFDLVLCTEVIEHIPDSQSALLEMHRLLRPGGTLVLTTPQRYSTMELACKVAFAPGMINLARLVYREPVLETGHVNLLSKRGVVAQLLTAGFDIDSQWLCGLYLPGIAELAGNRGVRAARSLERRWRGGALSFLLWTQCYVARRPA